MLQPQKLVEYKQATHFHFTCLTMASFGMNKYSKELKNTDDLNPKGVFQIGTLNKEGKPEAWSEMQNKEVIDAMGKNGSFSDTLAKSIVVLMYSLWEEKYRKEIALELKIEPKSVMSNVMGDLREIRNCIVHNKSIVTNHHKKIKVLGWPSKQGFFSISEDMFIDLKKAINLMQIEVNENT